MKRSTDGFTLIELLIVIAILGILLTLGTVNLLRAREQADEVVAKAYVREVSQGVETKRYGSGFTLPPAQSCAALADRTADPESVRSCTYTPGRRDAYSVSVESRTGATFRYDGTELEELP